MVGVVGKVGAIGLIRELIFPRKRREFRKILREFWEKSGTLEKLLREF